VIELALRHLLARKRQTFFIALGIVLGTAAYVAISGMMLGFQSFIIDQLVNNDSHIRIRAKEELITSESLKGMLGREGDWVFWQIPPSGRRDSETLEYPAGWFARLDNHPSVLAYSPQLSAQVLYRRGKISQTGRLIGSNPQQQSKVTTIQDFMIEGKFSDIGQSGNRIIMGVGLLQKLGARVGENISVSVGRGNPQPFRIVGSFRIGIQTVDDTSSFGALGDVQKVNQTPSRISDIAIRLTDVSSAGILANQWSSLTADKVQSWDQANENIMSVFKTQDLVRNTMTMAILIVAAFGIYNVLSILVTQKRREIAILRSMGFESKDILSLFLYQGLILGIIGGVVGLLAGYIICRYMETLPVPSGRIGRTGNMLVSFDLKIYLGGFALAFFSASLASLLPARAAGRLSPMDIIRSEASS